MSHNAELLISTSLITCGIIDS